MKKISELIQGNFKAIALAEFIRDNNVSYKVLPLNYGHAFCKVQIVDSRFESEVLFVATRSL